MKEPRFPVGLACVLLLPLGAFSGVLFHGFLYDDVRILEGNPIYQEPPALARLFSADYFALSRQGSYRPLTTLSYLADSVLWGAGPRGFHATNLLLHLANTALLAAFLRRLACAPGVCLAAAAAFGVHPAFTEVVSIPSYREDLLVLFFCSISFVLLLKGRGRGGEGRGEGWALAGFGGRVASAACYAAALLAKEGALGFLLFLGLFEWIGEAGRTGPLPAHPSGAAPAGAGLLRRTWAYGPHLGVTMLYLLLRFGLFRESNEVVPDRLGGSMVSSAWTMLGVLSSYVLMLGFPLHLRPDYVVQPAGLSGPAFLVSLAGLGLAAAACWVIARRGGPRPRAALGVAWSASFWLPVMNVYPIAHPKAERYLYLPSAGLLPVAVAVLAGAWLRLRSREARVAAAASGLLVLGCWTALSGARVFECREALTFWKAAVRCEPESATAHRNLGVEYLERDRLDLAREEFRRGVQIEPSRALALNLAWVDVLRARRAGTEASMTRGTGGVGEGGPPAGPDALSLAEALENAIQQHRLALAESRSVPLERALLHDRLGVLLRLAGRFDEACEEHRLAENLDPYSDEFFLHHGLTLQAAGDREAAVEAYRRAADRMPARRETHYNLGVALEGLKRLEKAEAAFEKAIELSPEYAEAFAGRGTVRLQRDAAVEAAADLERALSFRPERSDWRLNYLQALLRMGRRDAARQEIETLQVTPGLNPAFREKIEKLRSLLGTPER